MHYIHFSMKLMEIMNYQRFLLSIFGTSFHLGSLMYLNEATLLHNLKIRYKKDLIYVSMPQQ